MDLVVKFSRFPQEVPLSIETSFPDHVPAEVIDNARLNSPFEEFGLLMELCGSRQGPANLRIRTKLPLAIYSPPKKHEL